MARPLLGGDAVGVAGRIGEARQQLAAHALDGVGVEARLAERQRQQLDGLVAVLRQRLEAAVEGVARRRRSSCAWRSPPCAPGTAWRRGRPRLRPACRRGNWRRPPCRAGSWALPPSKAKRMAISGTACSSTSQAVMPPGLFTTWIFMASALLDWKKERRKWREEPQGALPCRRLRSCRTSVMPTSSEFVGSRLQDGGALGLRRRRDQPAGHGVADVEMLDGGAA